MSAIRLARAATGREKLLKFAGAYHGHVDGLLAEAGSGPRDPGAIPASPGVPRGATAATVIVPWNDPEAVRAPPRSTSSRRSSPSRTRPTWASSRPRTASSSCCASARRPPARCSSSTRSSPASASPAAAPRSCAGVMPDLTIMGKVIGGGLPAAAYGGPRELMERIAPAGDVYQAGTLSGQPARRRRRAGDARAARRGRLRAPAATTATSPTACARPPADRARCRSRPRPGLLTVFFSRRARPRLRRRAGVRPRRLRRLVPRAARARRLPAAVAVRGVVPVARARRRARRAHGRGGRGRVRGRRSEPWRSAAVLAVAAARRAACWPTRAAPGAGAGRRAGRRRGGRPALARPRGRRRVRRRGDPRGLPPALRRRAAVRRPRRPTSRCWPATASTRSASRASPRSATCDAVRELADVISLCAQAHVEGRPELADAAWEAGAAAVGWGATDALQAAKRRGAASGDAWRGRRPAVAASARGLRVRRLIGPLRFAPPPWQTTADRPSASTRPTAGSRARSRARRSRAGAS